MVSFVRARPWVILAGGALIQILTGIPAAWSVFRAPVMAEYALSATDAEHIFSLLLASFGAGCLPGGLIQDRRGPRAAGLAGTALLGIGFWAAGAIPAGAAGLFCLGFSIPVGLGCAFLTPAVLTCAQKWYPDRKGLATGVIGGAVGASGLVLTVLVRFFTARWGIRRCFRLLGGILVPVCGAGSLILCLPPAPKQRPQDQGRLRHSSPPDVTPRQMLHTRQFWLVAGALCLLTPTVQLFSPLLLELAQQRGLDERAALLCVPLGSVGSAAGRLGMPLLSDRAGRRTTGLLLFGALAGLSIGFRFAAGWWVITVYCLLCFCYAGAAALMPSLCSDLFGLTHAGLNYGVLNLGMSAGSLAFPLLAHTLGLEAGRHWLAAASAALGFACLLALRPLRGRQS